MNNYYKKHAKDFIVSTINCDMSEQYNFFEKHLNKKAKAILDLGFGSGRDSLYFIKKGYDVYAIDPEKDFCDNAVKLGINNVRCISAQELDYENKFDGIWACASLLHIPSNELNSVFSKCAEALKEKGIMYASFKYGYFEGMRKGRFFLDLNENSMEKYINDIGLKLLDYCITTDVRIGREDEKWLNIILIKK